MVKGCAVKRCEPVSGKKGRVSGKKASRARGEKEIKAPNERERERKKGRVSGKKGI